MFVVFDLDGTTADSWHREHLLQRPENPEDDWPEQDWGPWIAAAEFDEPIHPIVECARAMLAAGHTVEFWTGRGEECRSATLKWLERHGFGGLKLRMRPPAQPNLSDSQMKEQYLERYGVPDLIFEDRQSVVDMWRRNGIVCCQVAPGDY